MSVIKWCLTAVFAMAVSAAANAAVIVDYDLTGLTTTAPASTSATAVGVGITGHELTRGPGVEAAGLTNGFSADNWTLGSSLATAIASDEYYQFGFDVDATHRVSLSTFDTSLRRSAVNGPDNFHLFASFDGFATPGFEVASWNYFGRNSGTAPNPVTPFQWMTTDTPGQGNGNPITPQLLSDDPQLLNIGPNTSVTFRLYVWGDNDGAADSNTVALGRIDGPTIEGVITQVPEPASMLLVCGVAMLGLAYRRR